MEGKTRYCYEGATEPIGQCHTGKSTCAAGVWGPCLGQILPAERELCNNIDDDCDNETDEDLELATCDTTMQGECAVGLLVCGNGAAICRQAVLPKAELCDGKDNDCNGEIDEGESGQAACYSASTGCVANGSSYQCTGACRAGTQTCVDGETQPCIHEVTPVDESCDPQLGPTGNIAADEDCDGKTDEDCDCTEDATQSCYGGPPGTLEVGECAAGEQVCVADADGTHWTDCIREVLPEPETCANPGEDNDCNDAIDDIPLEGTPCVDETKQGRCRNGVSRCVDDELDCVTVEPRADERCDSTDDDCDGEVDEGFNLQDDERNCGSCGHACQQNETCCAGTCVDTSSSEAHCGACGSPCGSGISCCNSICTDTRTSLDHCGGCGQPCTGIGACCKASKCSTLLCL
jgi:hypothetical protein